MSDDLELGLAAEGVGLTPEVEPAGPELAKAPERDGAVYLQPADYANTNIPLLEGFAPAGAPWSPEIHLEAPMPSVPSSGVFAPEDRHYFNDRRLPWAAVGHIGWGGSGVLIGPRHVLTATHVLDWETKAPGSSGPFQYRYEPGSQAFKPGYYVGPKGSGPSAPFGEIPIDAVVTAMPWPERSPVYGVTDAAGRPVAYGRHLDVAVCILRERVGERVGWFGFSGWTHDWNGKSHFNHIGYPVFVSGGDGGIRPAIQTLASKASIHRPETATFRIAGGPPINASALRHDFDAQGGSSGGPIFGWFGKERMPRVVGVMNAIRPTPAGLNSAAGGMQMLRTIDKALKMFP